MTPQPHACLRKTRSKRHCPAMSRLPLLLFLALLLLSGCKTTQQAPGSWPRHRLVAEQTTALNLPDGRQFDASGLLLINSGDLLTLRNQHDSLLYWIEVLPGGKEADLVPFGNCFQKDALRTLSGDERAFDCEGIARDEQGRFYTCEERRRWILRCNSKTGRRSGCRLIGGR